MMDTKLTLKDAIQFKNIEHKFKNGKKISNFRIPEILVSNSNQLYQDTNYWKNECLKEKDYQKKRSFYYKDKIKNIIQTTNAYNEETEKKLND